MKDETTVAFSCHSQLYYEDIQMLKFIQVKWTASTCNADKSRVGRVIDS